MSAAGPGGARAFLALWNGIATPAMQPEYECWHQFEHVPERIGTPGMVEARRYRLAGGDGSDAHEWFTCYWVEQGAVFESERYLALVREPTPWSARMRPRLRGFQRLACRLAQSRGNAAGAHLAALVWRPSSPGFAGLLAQGLDLLVDRGAAAAAHCGTVLPGDFPLANQGDGGQPGDAVVLLEHTEARGLEDACTALSGLLQGQAQLLAAPRRYDLLATLRAQDLHHPRDRRQPPRPELLARFTNT